ncbi:MAG: MvaI/BcnI family restriction endonuclease [Bacteroidia bacterium]|nr:MvaI/BcnI family restriction endonuclease [Bacteroidia bacterium]
MKNLVTLKKEFNRIKKLGFVECTRPNNTDGGIGNTFEDLLGVTENNKKEADFKGFEVKSKRLFNSSFVSLFTKSPDNPKQANSYLRENFGEIRDENHSNKKKLYASVFGHRASTIYSKYKMKLKVDRRNKKLDLVISDLKDRNLSTVSWDFETLKKASSKMKDLFLVFADTKTVKKKNQYHFTAGEIYKDFDFDKFLKEIEKGGIMFDIRIGVYNSGKNYGKTHDHGSGFRVKAANFKNLYDTYETI